MKTKENDLLEQEEMNLKYAIGEAYASGDMDAFAVATKMLKDFQDGVQEATKANNPSQLQLFIDEIENRLPVKKTQVSIYLDLDVAEAFARFGKVNGKGAKSELVNNFLKEALKDFAE